MIVRPLNTAAATDNLSGYDSTASVDCDRHVSGAGEDAIGSTKLEYIDVPALGKLTSVGSNPAFAMAADAGPLI